MFYSVNYRRILQKPKKLKVLSPVNRSEKDNRGLEKSLQQLAIFTSRYFSSVPLLHTQRINFQYSERKIILPSSRICNNNKKPSISFFYFCKEFNII